MPHYHYSAMPPREEFRINGTLCTTTIEALIDHQEDMSNIELDSVQVWIKEAKGCFPSEDFLTAVRNDIRTVANRLRGRNKTELLELVEKLGEIESATTQESEYGHTELKKALECLKNG